MKKLISITTIVVLLCVLVFISWFEYYHVPPISFTDTKSKEMLFLPFIFSYESFAKFSTILEGEKIDFCKNNVLNLNKKNTPPFNIQTIDITMTKYLNEQGDIQIYFFNDRAMLVNFKPLNFDTFISKLKNIQHIEIPQYDESTQISQYVRVSWNFSPENKKVITWEDTRLKKEYLLWLKRYGY